MSKQESTAINELIDLARSGKRVGDDEAHLELFRPRPTMAPGLPPAPVVRTRTASGTQNQMPAIPSTPTLTAAPAPAPIRPGAMSFDVGQLSTPGMAIPASMRSTRAGLPPPPVAGRPPTQPPAFSARTRAEGTPAPELIRPPLPPSALPPVAVAEHAPETLPPESLQLTDTSSLVEKHALETLDSPPLPPPLPPLPPATLFPANPVATHPTVSMYPGQSSPVAPPVLPPEQLAVDVRVDVADRSADEQGWFDPTSNVKKQDPFAQPAAAAVVPGMPGTFEQQPEWGTMQIGRNLRPATAIHKRKWFVPAAIGGAVLLMFIIGAAAFSGEAPRHDAKAKTVATKDSKDANAKPAAKADADKDAKTAPAAVAQTAPATTPVTETPAASNAAIAAAAPAAASPATAASSNLVDVRFDSNPPGASVMLVDGGKTSFLGTAPVNASVDPSKRYDVVYTLAGHPTQVQHFDPSASHHITAALGGKATAATATPRVAAAAPAPAAPVAAPAPAPAPAAPAPTPHARPVQHAAAPAPAPTHVAQAAASDDGGDDAPAPSGPGTLMVASHPSCEILVDGKDTGKTTPQKGISLPAGVHKVRLLNKDANIDKTVTVSITAGVATKVLQNFGQ